MTDARVLCAHGYVLMQDSCPGCDHMGETPHVADVVRVVPSWTATVHRRCRQCGLVGSAKIHKGNR
jgi:uncharacterized Zn finger protein